MSHIKIKIIFNLIRSYLIRKKYNAKKLRFRLQKTKSFCEVEKNRNGAFRERKEETKESRGAKDPSVLVFPSFFKHTTEHESEVDERKVGETRGLYINVHTALLTRVHPSVRRSTIASLPSSHPSPFPFSARFLTTRRKALRREFLRISPSRLAECENLLPEGTARSRTPSSALSVDAQLRNNCSFST